MLEKKTHSGVDLAVLAAKGQSKLATELGVTQQAISLWVKQGWVPLGRAAEIEQKFDIPRHRLINPAIVSMLLTTP